jgi:hypothetical protein
MNKKYLIVLTAIVIACTGSIFFAGDVANSANGLIRTQWEYGVYRVGVGQYQYEWQSTDKYIYENSQITFLESMRLIEILKKRSKLADAQAPSLEYWLDAEFLNYLGTRGWELVSVIDRGSGAIVNRTFWFKRPKLTGKD